jgi:ribA/ribD-fused uncharacterized protein
MADQINQEREYPRREAAAFRTTDGPFGALSNMAPGFPLVVGGIRFWTSEALYQCCRFPHLPEVQRLIILEKSPMTAKMKSKRFRSQTRPDWEKVRIKLMKWCLRIKLVQHPQRFGELLRATAGKPIVEESVRDPFWGAKPSEDGILRGKNVLGRLLMELRDEVLQPNALPEVVEPPELPNLLLLGRSVERVCQKEPRDNSLSQEMGREQEELFGQDVRIAGELASSEWLALLRQLAETALDAEIVSLDLTLHLRYGHEPEARFAIERLSEIRKRFGLRSSPK